MGHLSMCLSLARAFRDELGGESHFLVLESSRENSFIRWIEDSGVRVWTVSGRTPHREDPEKTLAALDSIAPDAVITDLLTADPSDRDFFNDPTLELIDVPKYIGWLQGNGHRVVAVSYNDKEVRWAPDLLVAIHPGQLSVRYPDDQRRRLLGPDYYVIDPDTARFRDRHRELDPDGRRVVLSFGGSDPDGLTIQVAQSLASVERLELTAIIGPANPSAQETMEELSELGVKPATDVQDLAALLWETDLALTAAGHTLYEMAFLGTPALVISTRKRQEENARWFHEKGSIVHLGRIGQLDPISIRECVTEALQSAARREEMSRSGRALIDGRGGLRLCRALSEVLTA
jgi:spore coat polysaccharide biosynthesis predicted glycosyltransferase SpsG